MCSTKIWPFCSYLNVSTGKCCLQNESLCSSFNVLEIPPLFHIVQTQWNICLGKLGHHSFRKWFDACSAPSQYLNQHLLVNLRNFNWMNWKCCLQNGSYFFLASNLLNHWDWMMHICITKQGQLTHWGRDKMDAISQTTFSHENCCILIEFSLKYVRKGPIDNNLDLVQIMAWRRPGDKPLSEPMMISLPMHICFARPQWVNDSACCLCH